VASESLLQIDRYPFKTKKRSANIALRYEIKKRIELACDGASLRLDCFLVSFRGELLGNGFLDFFSVHPVAFGCVNKNVVTAGGGSLIRRIQQADFEEKLAKFGLIICAYLLGQKLLRGRRVLL
jgi:hypothetical protein